ncbi:DUF4038 domain-containing protein [Echinicola sp. 20G]|uniref:apiosidase-like domain-containing protein n=1 Tax=Echinicola sp. 20G TaxID=2781961 RepID=UPI0019110D62|nr:DUF4038 domain-containing protein [Echinicola sp. 20G]
MKTIFQYYSKSKKASKKHKKNNTKLLQSSLIALLYLALLCPAFGQLSVSENGRYLVKQDGKPFFWLGDTAWGLFQKLDREEVDFYLKERAEQGYSVIHAAAVHKNPFIVPELENSYGDKAFANEALMKPAITEGNDPEDSNAYDYWDHVDYIIDKAEEHGLTLVFLPLFGMTEGDAYNLITPGNAYQYGTFLGKRYQHKGNLIWCMGGDVLAESPTQKAIWNLLARGITEGIAQSEDYSQTLMTYHVRGGHSSSDYFENAPWIDFHMIQTWDSYTKIYGIVSNDYNHKITKPVLHGEGAYEDGPEYPTKPITPHKIRKQAYWATFAGGMHTYGNTNIWSFGSNPKYFTEDWKEALLSEGAQSMFIYQAFFQSINWWDFIPDQSVFLEGKGDGDHLNVAMQSESNQQLLVYFPEPAEVILDLKIFKGEKDIFIKWFDPKTGKEIKPTKEKNKGTLSIKTPNEMEDALLLLSSRK